MAVAVASVVASVVASCAMMSPTLPAPRHGTSPHYLAPMPGAPAPGGVALVLSGGSARGFAHIGVIKALEANGLRPDLVVGTSAGSIVGALYASGLSAAQLEAAVSELDARAFTDLALPGLGLLPGAMGLVRGDSLHRFIDDRVKRHHIEDFPIRFAAIATDMSTGEAQIFNAGDVGLAVRASSAVPGFVMPLEIGKRLFGDGQLSSPIPVDAARRLGARVVIAVDVVYPPQDAAPRNAFGILFQAFTITVHRLKDVEAARADLVIVPALGRTSGQFSFGDRARLVAAGEQATLEALGQLRPLFAVRDP